MIEKVKENLNKAIENGDSSEADRWLHLLSQLCNNKELFKLNNNKSNIIINVGNVELKDKNSEVLFGVLKDMGITVAAHP